jgi:hypothetical protein
MSGLGHGPSAPPTPPEQARLQIAARPRWNKMRRTAIDARVWPIIAWAAYGLEPMSGGLMSADARDPLLTKRLLTV